MAVLQDACVWRKMHCPDTNVDPVLRQAVNQLPVSEWL